MENEEIFTSDVQTRHNATISYCFLAVIMLFSRDERFTNSFVRSHAKYASLLHAGFLILIIGLIYTQGIASLILYSFSWVSGIFFLAFIVLLYFLGAGMYRAMRGYQPRHKISLKVFTTEKKEEIQDIISDEQKIPLMLAHIPFVGSYLVSKYGDWLSAGEKFGNWGLVAIALSLWLDPSLTLPILMLTLITFWIVYQTIVIIIGEHTTTQLLGKRFLGVNRVHILIASFLLYVEELFAHGRNIPKWGEIQEKVMIERNSRQEIPPSRSIFLQLPFLNLVPIIHEKEATISSIHDIICDILWIVALLYSHTPLLLLLTLSAWWSVLQAKKGLPNSIPFIEEISVQIMRIIKWKRQKSISQEVHFPTK